jgi:hypothetical protein
MTSARKYLEFNLIKTAAQTLAGFDGHSSIAVAP